MYDSTYVLPQRYGYIGVGILVILYFNISLDFTGIWYIRVGMVIIIYNYIQYYLLESTLIRVHIGWYVNTRMYSMFSYGQRKLFFARPIILWNVI